MNTLWCLTFRSRNVKNHLTTTGIFVDIFRDYYRVNVGKEEDAIALQQLVLADFPGLTASQVRTVEFQFPNMHPIFLWDHEVCTFIRCP